MARPAVFLDRDGVLDEPVPDPGEEGRAESPYRPEDVRLAPGAVAGLRALRAQGFVLVVVSNQPAAAKGTVGLDDLVAVHDRLVALLAEHDVRIDEWRYCHHHPAGIDPALTGACACRKPAPGMLTAAAAAHDLVMARSWMVGDADTDVEAGRAAGCGTVLIAHARTAHRRSGAARPTLVAPDLAAAASAIARHSLR
jgi:D-glycero-D-manno-heptose 1,7-bisphosphate phosphatase